MVLLLLVVTVADHAIWLPPVCARTEGEAQLLGVLSVLGDLAKILGCSAKSRSKIIINKFHCF